MSNNNSALRVVYKMNGNYNLSTTTANTVITSTSAMSSYPIYPNYMYPVLPVIPVQNPVYGIHFPYVINTGPIVTTQGAQVSPHIMVAPPVTSSSVSTTNDGNGDPLVCCSSDHFSEESKLDPTQYEDNYVDICEDVLAEADDSNCYSVKINGKIQYAEEINENMVDRNQNYLIGDPLEFYLTLPKELFPAARTLTADPNPLIDEFCKIFNIEKHTPWILDLEFGVSNVTTPRFMPTYNVKLNSVNCINAPYTPHPDFDVCDKYFKDVFLSYYDTVISTWHRGYMVLNNDRSVDNFQNWMLLPSQVLGMCWS